MSTFPAMTDNSTGVESDDAAPVATTEREITRAIALLLEDLLTESEFMALTGIDPQTVPQRLADPAALAGVERTAMQMRNSGALARLEAARHARTAVGVAVAIMNDLDMHPSHRISAATFIARASGTERPVSENSKASEGFTVTIHLGDDHPPTVIGGNCSHELGDQHG